MSLRTFLLQVNLIVSSHHCAIQEKDEEFYLQFQIVICGLDSVEARRWINATLVNMVDWDDPQRTLKPLIDGGTEGISDSFKRSQFQGSVAKPVLSSQLRVLAMNALWICLPNALCILYVLSPRHLVFLNIALSGLRCWNGLDCSLVCPSEML